MAGNDARLILLDDLAVVIQESVQSAVDEIDPVGPVGFIPRGLNLNLAVGLQLRRTPESEKGSLFAFMPGEDPLPDYSPIVNSLQSRIVSIKDTPFGKPVFHIDPEPGKVAGTVNFIGPGAPPGSFPVCLFPGTTIMAAYPYPRIFVHPGESFCFDNVPANQDYVALVYAYPELPLLEQPREAIFVDSGATAWVTFEIG